MTFNTNNMEAILKFNLPEETEEFNLAIRGSDYSCLLHEFDQYLRTNLKHVDLPDAKHESYQEIRDKLYELANNYKIEL